MSDQQPHYSDLTLQALMDNHGWERGYALGPEGGLTSVRREFAGVGPLGGMAVPDGTRRLYAGYHDDSQSRRYIALELGDKQIADLDGRDASPAEIARLINLKAEQFADLARLKQGLPAMYAVGSPALTLPSGAPGRLRDEAAAVAHYDAQRNPALTASIELMLDEQDRPYRLLRAGEIQPGDVILQTGHAAAGYRVEAVETDALGQVRHRFGDDTGCSSYAAREFLRVAESPALRARLALDCDHDMDTDNDEPGAPRL